MASFAAALQVVAIMARNSVASFVFRAMLYAAVAVITVDLERLAQQAAYAAQVALEAEVVEVVEVMKAAVLAMLLIPIHSLVFLPSRFPP